MSFAIAIAAVAVADASVTVAGDDKPAVGVFVAAAVALMVAQ